MFINNYQRTIEKNEELQRNMERNEKEYSIQNDFNAKFEEIKELLINQQNINNPFSIMDGDQNENENENNECK